MTRSFFRGSALLTLGLLAVPAISNAQYTAYDLGAFPGGSLSKAFGIDNAGYITGYATTTAATTPTHAFIANGNLAIPALVDLGTTGGPASNGYAINTLSGVETVTGNSSVSAGNTALQAAYFNPAGHNAGVVSGATTGILRAVNSNGLAVGYSNNGATAVTYQIGSGATSLTSIAAAFGNPAVSQAYGVNNSGVITGYYGTISANQVFSYNTATSTLTNLGTLGGVSATSDANGGGFGINASGNIAGYAKISTGALHAFLYDGVVDPTTGLKLHDLGVPSGSTSTSFVSTAYSINAKGDVVGNFNLSATGGNVIGNFHAYIYKSGSAFGGSGLVDLSTASNIAGSDFASLDLAYGINDNGWIVGQGVTVGGQNHAFLLKPNGVVSVPEPGAVLAMSMGLLGMGALLRRRSRK